MDLPEIVRALAERIAEMKKKMRRRRGKRE